MNISPVYTTIFDHRYVVGEYPRVNSLDSFQGPFAGEMCQTISNNYYQGNQTVCNHVFNDFSSWQLGHFSQLPFFSEMDFGWGEYVLLTGVS